MNTSASCYLIRYPMRASLDSSKQSAGTKTTAMATYIRGYAAVWEDTAGS
jgi:hypothetical protein